MNEQEFVAKLLRLRGVPDTPKARANLLKRVNKAIDNSIVDVLKALPPEQFDQLKAAVQAGKYGDTNNIVECGRFLTDVGADPDQVIKKALEKFARKYLKDTDYQ